VKLVDHVEGRTRLIVPAVSLEADPPPTSPVFFNPAASLNRDISVCVTSAAGGSNFCDSMAGVGARGVRVANEVGRIERVTLVDFNKEALGLAKKAAALNKVASKCEFAQSETSSYLYSRYGRGRRFDFVDVDPFGTPVGQLQGAICATSDGGILSLTATDTAVLCGVYPKVARRRYGATPLNNEFGHETAIRILAGTVVRSAASLDKGALPVAAHSTRHYVRLYCSIGNGATKADSALTSIGHVSWCPSCGHTSTPDEPKGICEVCGKKARSAGPLWVGPLCDTKLLMDALRMAEGVKLKRASETMTSLLGVDSFPPWSFSVDGVCSALGVATVSESEVCRILKEEGHSAMRTPFEKAGLKTDATYAELAKVVETSAGLRNKTGETRQKGD
jgi:tRNA (guanine26-N2/guanine27-N2)-dimethyltransferase